MTSQGDNSIVYTTQNGEKVAIPPGNAPSIGDKVLVHRLPDGTLAIHGNSSINVGDTVLVTRTRTGEYIAVKGGVTSSNCVKVTDGFLRDVNYQYEVVNLGTFNFNWDGKARVYLMQSCQNTPNDTIWADDYIQVTTSKGTLNSPSYDDSNHYIQSGPPVEITSMLVVGDNEITINICDLYAWSIGCAPLYIVPYYG
jgi:hypothetical protein